MDGRGPLVTKLSRFIPLSDEDVRVLDALCLNEERVEADTDIVRQGDVPRSAFVLTHGMACRYRLMPDGKRQILTFMIPGDIFGLLGFLLRAMDHSIATLVPTRIATISRNTVFDLFEHHPRIGAALWWSALQQNAINRERIVALGRRSARGRVAYLLCELVWRQRAVGLAEDHAIRLPLTQIELADTLGLTAVHVNRILQRFRRDSLITLERRRLKLLDVGRLQKIAGFNQDYLHLDGATAEVRSYVDALERNRREVCQLPHEGVSRAESRLTAALLAGKALREAATDFEVQITTLRTQLSSVLRKVGVSRQAELIRVLSSIPVVPASLPDVK